MAKLTLLEITQSVLNDMDSDEVNSISDTIESLQVAQIIKDTYYDLITKRDWPHLSTLFVLDSVSDTDRPNYLKLPVSVYEMEIIKYNKRKSTDTRDKYDKVNYQEPDTFLTQQNSLNESNSNVTQITDSSNVKYNIYNDRPPTSWTSFDDEYIVFNSYDSAVESTLQGSKTQCNGRVEPPWTVADSFVPDFPSEAFPLLVEESKSAAFITLKQVANEKAEQRAQSQKRRQSRKSWRHRGGVRYPDYGRSGKSSGTKSSPYFDKT
jgi:hypothetical protein